MLPFADYVGQRDSFGYELRVSTLCVADELGCGAVLYQLQLFLGQRFDLKRELPFELRGPSGTNLRE